MAGSKNKCNEARVRECRLILISSIILSMLFAISSLKIKTAHNEAYHRRTAIHSQESTNSNGEFHLKDIAADSLHVYISIAVSGEKKKRNLWSLMQGLESDHIGPCNLCVLCEQISFLLRRATRRSLGSHRTLP